MFLTKKDINVRCVTYGKNTVEMIMIEVEDRYKKSRKFVINYVPPKTASWEESEHKSMLEDTKITLNKIMADGGRIVMMGDFNCKEICWEEMTVKGGDGSWGNALLEMITDNTMTQWIQENTRYRNEEEPSRLDLIITSEPRIVDKIEY
ncbi:uncharacterized protein LOC143028322 [Oratosquilla oratoria]|uniref:uncharacterized protein LOC143028322 n=1 Tax=Oratosquilla oratoria TaxID=337810 RepID=UPI003F7601A2